MKSHSVYIALITLLSIQNIHPDQTQTAACAEYAAMKTGELGKDLSAGTLFLLGEIAEKGINIRKFHFAGSIEGIEQGVLPKVEIEGIVLGQPFKISINITDDDLRVPTHLIAKIVSAIEQKENDPLLETQLIPVTNKPKE